MPYILAIKARDGCVFCDDVLAEGGDSNLVIHRGRHAFVILNLYPYATGHLMVVPYRHVPSMGDLLPDELAETAALLQSAERVIEEEYRAFTHHVGINLGRCAGAGVEGHLHIHLVPKGTREGMAEPLLVTRDRLIRAWQRSPRIGLSHRSDT